MITDTVPARIDTTHIPGLGFLAYAVSDQGLVLALFFFDTAENAAQRLADTVSDMQGFAPVHEIPEIPSRWHTLFEDFFRGGAPAANPSLVPLDGRRWTSFQRDIYCTLRDNVGWGETISYGELAALAGYPGAARAVGTAMASNNGGPFIPCHRVIAAGGNPGGYSGIGGPALKKKLLDYERDHPLVTFLDPEHP